MEDKNVLTPEEIKRLLPDHDAVDRLLTDPDEIKKAIKNMLSKMPQETLENLLKILRDFKGFDESVQ